MDATSGRLDGPRNLTAGGDRRLGGGRMAISDTEDFWAADHVCEPNSLSAPAAAPTLFRSLRHANQLNRARLG
jgi:hypothetical protein